jgi:hypothetical protein
MLSTALIEELLQCVGFQVESPSDPVGFVEEVWLGPEDEPTALALRTVEGHAGFSWQTRSRPSSPSISGS